MKNYIKGYFQRYIYENNGFAIGLMHVKETNNEDYNEYLNKDLTFTGYMEPLNEKDNYIFYGEMIMHPKYGLQFNVSSYEKIKPNDIDGVKEFLASDLFTGIGEKMASSIVDILGEDALNKILDDKNCLTLVPKLSSKKANLIYSTLVKYEESHKTIVYLTELGFTMHASLAIYNIYKENTIMMIEHNIYDILDKTNEVSFPKIDEIALKSNNYDEINRVKACIVHIMNSLIYKNSDTYLNYDEIKLHTLSYLNYEIDDELFSDYLNELLYENKIIIEEDRYYPIDIYKSEITIVDKIKKLLSKRKNNISDIDDVVASIQKRNNITYNDKQLFAIKKALENHISIITGGPGTGKTTIINAILTAYIDIKKLDNNEIENNIALLAPTGRASKRLSETTLFPSSTIHRFLKWNKDNNAFGINEYNKAFQKFIIIDEASMIDANLLSSLFKGLNDNIQIVFVGDYHQLPSVGPGQILKDMIESNAIDTIELDVLYRQNVTSYIPYLAHNIKNNIEFDFLEKHSDYTFLTCNSSSIKNNLCEICTKIIDKKINLKNMQIMAPTYLGINGIDALNKEIQKVFNPKSKDKNEMNYGDVVFRENDKVLQLVNMPDDNVFNGDVGIIKEIVPAMFSESKKTEVYVDYDGNIVMYTQKDLNKIKHGFVISIHKSQGSEYETVIIPLALSYNRMLYKKLLYTGITRAKKKLILLGEPQAFLKGIQNNYEIERKTSLKQKLMNS